jgi:hypothetical protein
LRTEISPAQNPFALYTSMNTHVWVSKIISRILLAIIGALQATTLRERYYTLQERNTILETAIDDIARINRANSNDPLIKGITDRMKHHE